MIADTVKIDLKVLAATPPGGPAIALERAIPVFHRFVQERALDELTVDVADYTHVPGGPGVVLVCHDAIYSLDSAGGALGLLYSRRRETHSSLGVIASLDDRLASVFRRALAACALIERERDLAGLRFPSDRFELAVNDRRVPPAEAGELVAALERLSSRLFPGERPAIEIDRRSDRLGATLRRERGQGAAELLSRLDASAPVARAQAGPSRLS